MSGAGRGHGRVHSAAGRLLWVTGVTALASRALTSDGRFALLLHGISSRRLQSVDRHTQPHLTSEDLTQLLDWLVRRFAFLTPAEYLAGNKSGVLLTFDDGFANNFRQALPILRSFECPAVFFVSTQHVANPRNWLTFVRQQAEQVWGSLDAVPEDVACDWYDGMSVEELRQSAADPLVTIGSHGVTHSVLTECDDDQLMRELRESKAFLEEVTGEAVECFAYPRGEYDARVARRTGDAGYNAAFVIDSIGLGTHCLELPRVGIYQADRTYLSLKLSGLHRRPLRVHDR